MFNKGKKKSTKNQSTEREEKNEAERARKSKDKSSCSAFHSVPEVQNAIRSLNDLSVLIIKYHSFKSGCLKSVLKRSLINTST